MAEVQTIPDEMASTIAASNEVVLPPETEGSESTALATMDADDTAVGKKKVRKIIKKKRRPARPQVDPATFKTEPPPQTGTIFNIWYNKWSGGDREDAYMSKHQAKGRCNVALDSGYTRADKIAGSYFCLFFARGLCPKGQDCEYLHRLPNSRVEKEGGLGDIFPSNVDCFGRDKFSDYRDDMGGVGSFMRVNRTLYVGRIHVTDDIEEIVARHFQEWGQVERSKSCHKLQSNTPLKRFTSTGVAFAWCCIHHLRTSCECGVCQRGHGPSVSRPQRNAKRKMGYGRSQPSCAET